MEEFDEFEVNSGYLSDCCSAPIYGETVGDIGICSRCKEWSGFSTDPEEKQEKT